jgi:iron(III) transport system substrate-binding protein
MEETMIDMKHTTRRTWLSLAATCIAAMVAAAPVSAQSKLGATFDEIVAGAKKEGKLVAWIVAPRGPDTHKTLIEAFNKRFGLETKMEWVPNSPVQSNTRAITEKAGGSVSVDVIGGGAIEEVAAAAKADLIKPYPWGQMFGAAMPAVKDLEDRVIGSYKGTALAYQQIAYVLAWNPTLITEDKLPAKLTDLADPQWQGKFAFNSFFLVPLDVTSYAMGSEATLDFAKKLLANKPVLEKGTPSVARAVVTGAVPIGVTVSPVAETSVRKGEPLKYKLFADYIPVSQVHLYVPEGSPNPNTARLFAAWLAAEGSAVGDKLEPMDRVGDPAAKLPKMIAEQVAKSGAKIAQPAKLEDTVESAKLREAINLLISGQTK